MIPYFHEFPGADSLKGGRRWQEKNSRNFDEDFEHIGRVEVLENKLIFSINESNK